MNCTTAVFTLMSGASLLAFATLYFYNRNIVTDSKLKVSTMNNALTSLQAERSDLMNKSNDMYVETATKSVMVDKLSEELNMLQNEKEALIRKNEDLTAESDSKPNLMDKLNTEIQSLKETVGRLQNDNQLLIEAYKNIEETRKS